MKLTKNFFAVALIIVSLGVAFYVWKYKVSGLEIDYTKVTFEGNEASGETKEKSIADCAASSFKESRAMGKTKADEKHFDFFCRCVKYNTSEKSNLKDTLAVQKNCWSWSEDFFQIPGLFDK